MNLNFKIIGFAIVLILVLSCSSDDTNDTSEPIDEPNPSIYRLSELKTDDGAGIENVYLYTFDSQEKLLQISQNNPLNSPNQANVYDLIYTASGMLTSITLKIDGDLINTFPVSINTEKITFEGFGANQLNFYYDENSLIVKKERVFDSNTTVLDYNYNTSNQLDQIIVPAKPPNIPPGLADFFSNYDSETPIFYFSELTNPVEDFIALYVFDLKYSLVGKPMSNKDGAINYSYENSNLTTINFGSGSSITFKYIDIAN